MSFSFPVPRPGSRTLISCHSTYIADYDPVVKSYYIPPIPPAQPPPPKRFSAAYWKSFGKVIPIPPPLRFKFPFNIVSPNLIKYISSTTLSSNFFSSFLARYHSSPPHLPDILLPSNHPANTRITTLKCTNQTSRYRKTIRFESNGIRIDSIPRIRKGNGRRYG